MGSLISCFSCSSCSFENKLNSTIFQPPNRIDINQIFESIDCVQTIVRTQSGNMISTVIETPSNHSDDTKKCIIFCHGNHSDNIQMINFVKWLSTELKICVIIFDYPGYGNSSGQPTEQSCYESMESVVKFVLNDMDIMEKNIFLMGQSLGTGIVIDYVYKHNWNTPIILISPYKSICKIVYDSSLVNPIDKFKSLNKIKNINCPVKIFHGEIDTLINISHGKTLYKHLNNKLFEPSWLNGIGHNDILGAIELTELIKVINYATS